MKPDTEGEEPYSPACKDSTRLGLPCLPMGRRGSLCASALVSAPKLLNGLERRTKGVKGSQPKGLPKCVQLNVLFSGRCGEYRRALRYLPPGPSVLEKAKISKTDDEIQSV